MSRSSLSPAHKESARASWHPTVCLWCNACIGDQETPSCPGYTETLDWRNACRAASGRLGRLWTSEEETGPGVQDELVQELAALLCAYGELGPDADQPQKTPGPTGAGDIS